MIIKQLNSVKQLNTIKFSKHSTESFSFDGTNELIDLGVGHALAASGATEGTWAAWIKSSGGSNQAIFSKYSGAGGEDLIPLIRLQSTVIRFHIRIGGVLTYRDSSVTVNDDNWHFIVCRFQGSTAMDIFVDGVLRNGTLSGSIPASLSAVSTNNAIGKVGGVGASPFDGNMDEVSIWDTFFTNDEILEAYNDGCPPNLAVHSAIANCRARYRFNEGSTIAISKDEEGVYDGVPTNMDATNISTDVPC